MPIVVNRFGVIAGPANCEIGSGLGGVVAIAHYFKLPLKYGGRQNRCVTSLLEDALRAGGIADKPDGAFSRRYFNLGGGAGKLAFRCAKRRILETEMG